jgi:hypothetical protein
MFALLAVGAVAALASLLVAYRISLDPPALHPREVEFSVAKAEVLIDTPVSQVGDLRQNFYLPLTPEIAVTDALYAKSDGVLQAAAAAAGIPGQEVSASGPFTLLLNRTNVVAKGPPTSPNINKNYRLLVDVDGANPMITLYGQAPTTRTAIAIVSTVRDMLIQEVAHQEKIFPLPAAVRVVLRPLGPVTGGAVDPGARVQLMLFVFCLVTIVGCALVLSIHRRSGPAHRATLAELDQIGDESSASDDWPHTKRLLPWLMAVFLGMIFLVPIDQMTLPVHLPLASNPDRVLLILIAAVWFAALLLAKAPERPRIRFTGIHFAVFAFVTVAFLSVTVNGLNLATYQEVGGTLKKILLLATFVIFFIIASSVVRPREVPRFMTLMVVLGVVVAFSAILESKMHFNIFYSLWPNVFPTNLPAQLDQLDNIGRLTVDGPTSEPLELAALLAMVIPFAIIGALDARTRKHRILYILSATILLAGSIATERKTSVVCPVIGLLVLTAYRPRAMIRAVLISAVPLFIAVHLLAPGQIGSVLAELLPSHATTVTTTTDRVARYDAVRPDVMSHLLLGRGFQSYDPVKYRILDNEYLGLLIGVGVIGLAIYLSIFIGLLRIAHPTIRGPDPRRAATALPIMAALVIAMVANALFDVLSFPHVSYLFFFVAAMMLSLRERSPEASPAAVAQPPAQRPRPQNQSLPRARSGVHERAGWEPVRGASRKEPAYL